MQTKKNIHRTASFNKKKRFENIKLVSFRHFLSTFLHQAKKNWAVMCVLPLILLFFYQIWNYSGGGGYFCLLRDSLNIVLRDVKHSPKMFETTKGQWEPVNWRMSYKKEDTDTNIDWQNITQENTKDWTKWTVMNWEAAEVWSIPVPLVALPVLTIRSNSIRQPPV